MIFTRQELKQLVEETANPVVSIFMPTHRTGNIEQDPIRLKNILRQAEDRLVEAGIRAPEARRIIGPAVSLRDDGKFWSHQSDGLALFMSPGSFRYYRLPYGFDELMMVGDRCYIKPLLPLFHGDGSFYVLALSQNSVRFLQCTRYGQRPITPDNIPGSISEALKYDDREKQHQFHTTGPGPAIFHGQGASKDYDKENILRFCQQVDRGLNSMLRDEKEPLVVAAVDYIFPIYREASTYNHLVKEPITGNPDKVSDDELREQAWKIVEPIFTGNQARALNDYQSAAGTGLTVSDLEGAVLAAYDGRLSILLFATGVQQWGSFDVTDRRVRLFDGPEPGAGDLVDDACVYTLLNGGDIYALPPESMPGGTMIAGILRY